MSIGLRIGVSGLAMGAAGGSLPPYAFPANAMDIGMGLSGITGYSGYFPFANILLNAGVWEQTSGSGDWSVTNDGEVAATVSTDRFRAIIVEGMYDKAPLGTYTVLNPNGCKIGFGAYTDQTIAAFTTATSFTFNYAGDRQLNLHAEGSCSGVKVIIPGHLTSFNAGNPWNSDFLTFQNGLPSKAYRFMDWVSAYQDIVEDWADVSLDPMTCRSPSSRLLPRIPYPLLADLCNRTGRDMYLNLPTRVTDDYCTQLATLLKNTLNPNRYVMIEFGNEVWNIGGAYYESRSWVEHINNTLYEAVPNFGIDGFTKVGHGLNSGDIIVDFMAKENHSKFPIPQEYPFGIGLQFPVEKVDNDNFRILDSYPGGAVHVPAAGMVKLPYKKHAPDTGVVNVETNYGTRSKQIWDIFDSILGRNRCLHIIGTQLAISGVTTARLAPTGVLAATDCVATAFYNTCDWWLAALDIESGQVTPKGWSWLDEGSIRIAFYANGSPTPLASQIDAGTGTGFIAARTIDMPTVNQPSWVAASAVTGLVDGTTYRAEIIYTGENGVRWRAVQSFTVSATPSTIVVEDSTDNIAARFKYGTAKWMTYVPAQITAAQGKPMINYEIGPDIFFNNNSMPEVKASRAAFSQTSQAGDVFLDLYRTLAANGYKFSAQFTDVNAAAPGVFSLADAITDTSDPRYLAVAGFNGQVPYTAPLAISSPILANNIATEPSYPYTIYTFPVGQTPTIYGDNLDGNYAVVGREVRLVSGVNIDWGAPTARSVRLMVSDGNTRAYPTLSFSTGDAWYESDAQFAWSAVIDTDPVALDPNIGDQLPQTAGATPAVWDDNALTFDGTKRYDNATGMADVVPSGTPFLLAVTMDKNGDNSAGIPHAFFGISNYAVLDQGFTDMDRLRWVMVNSPVVLDLFTTPLGTPTPSGKHVHWFYYDGAANYNVGMDQTENTAVAGAASFASGLSRNIYIGGFSSAASKAKIGAVQVISRTGLTLAAAKSIVAKMQAHHGIA